MRFLPVFLDLTSGAVVLVGTRRAGPQQAAPARAPQARACVGSSACAPMSREATAGHRGGRGRPSTSRRPIRSPPTFRHGRDRRRRPARPLDDAIAARARADAHSGQRGRPARSLRPSSCRRSSIAATWWWRSAPAARLRCSRDACASASRRCCRQRIGELAEPDGALPRAASARDGERRSRRGAASGSAWWTVRSASAILAGTPEAEAALVDAIEHAPAATAASPAPCFWSAPDRAIPISSRCARCMRCRMPTSCSTTSW